MTLPSQLAPWFPHGIETYLIGGIVLGLGVALLFVTTGLIGGMSTVFSSSWSYVSSAPFFQQARLIGSRQWRLWYAAGLIIGALLYFSTFTSGVPFITQVSWWQLLAGGFLVGFGARLANGCTSGHGICGLGSLQLPSLLAVLTFLATAFVTANVVLALGGR
jgi:uncharacterized membrane protein YedE/YeeE